jgi:hypothetical protein
LKEPHPVDWFEVWEDKPRRSIIRWVVAIIVSILLNSIYIMGFPTKETALEVVQDSTKEEDEFLIDLADEEALPEYVEANPDKVENEPDETNNISDRDQQAAQENVAGPDPNETPYLEGEDPESSKLLEGQIPQEGESSPRIEVESRQTQNSEPRENQQPQPQQPESPPIQREGEQTESPESMPFENQLDELPTIPAPPPTPEFIDPEEESDDPEGTKLTIIEDIDQEVAPIAQEESEDRILNINIPPSVAEQMALAIEAQKAREAQKAETQPAQQPNPSPQKPTPAPRPRLKPSVLPGPLMDSQVYAARMDVIGFDAKFSQFGHYLSRMFEAIQLQWYSLLSDVTIGQEKRPAWVRIRFTLNSEGRVVDAQVLDTNAGNLATLLCQDAIESRSPYGFWTEQMVDQLGDQQEIEVRFIYL